MILLTDKERIILLSAMQMATNSYLIVNGVTDADVVHAEEGYEDARRIFDDLLASEPSGTFDILLDKLGVPS